MPNSDQTHGSQDYEPFPNLRKDIGENPARYLDRRLLDNPDDRDLALARIRGIDSIAAVRAWRAVERNDQTAGPRDAILEALDQRESELEAQGERPDRLAHGPRRPPEMVNSESQAEMATENVDVSVSGKLATDGGER